MKLCKIEFCTICDRLHLIYTIAYCRCIKDKSFSPLKRGEKERFYQGQKGVFDSPIEKLFSVIFDIDS